MNLTDSLLPSTLGWLWIVFALVLAWSLRSAPWPVLRKPGILNLMLGACVLVLGFWQIKAGIRPGLNLHILGATLLTLLFGPWFALLGLMLVLLLTTFWDGAWHAFALNALLMGVVPVTVSWWLYRLTDRYLPNHLFIYIFINGFVGAALSVALTGVAVTLSLAEMGAYALMDLVHTYLPYFLLMAWSEAVTTGMLITVLVVYRPQWVATFDDKHYVDNK
ncbi:energy-coupling factor ABC transporter permease [Sulfuriferula thiophila]|uniref:energy-coupling factor ABC transporter permease n=1 Tax=Sulfuriferula thiophila TaxID=1781211 RepID=UPI000F610867|nr:energy-coupling factor ABC transporter permease [Sulfuriferula thiophila]